MGFCKKNEHSTIIWLTFQLSDKILNNESSPSEFYSNLSINWHNKFTQIFFNSFEILKNYFFDLLEFTSKMNFTKI